MSGVPSARDASGEATPAFRIAELLDRITGWELFGGGDERAYVSTLWAEDWDSPEDSAGDEQCGPYPLPWTLE